MSSSRAMVVLGMHRNGTSVLTRGLQELDVHLGDDFLAAKPDNPTGYWENRQIVALNERILEAFGLHWHSIERITEAQWRETDLEPFRTEATRLLRDQFLHHPVWGFKDPRTILLLPFWRPLLESLGVDDRYVVAIRNPLSVAQSLYTRQGTGAVHAHQMWLLHMVPQLHRIAGRPFVVVDYDKLMGDPEGQLARIARRLDIPLEQKHRDSLARFTQTFVRPELRHHHFSSTDFETIPNLTPVSRECYLWLNQLATDRIDADSVRFWTSWKRLNETTATLIDEAVAARKRQEEELRRWREEAVHFVFKPCRNFPDVRLFVVTGTQRTGTNLLRELLNTNSSLAMMAEILTPCVPPGHRNPGPPYPDQSEKEAASSYQLPGMSPGFVSLDLDQDAYWGNFLRTLPSDSFPATTAAEAEALLDRYFEFLLDLIRRRWADGQKRNVRAIGVDIKYTHLHRLAPHRWDAKAQSFLLSYFRARGVTLIHAVRRNMVHCTISDLAVRRTGRVHNYAHQTMDGRFTIDSAEFLGWARRIVRDREMFRRQAAGLDMVEYEYEDLVHDLTRAEDGTGRISPGDGPLRTISAALDVPFEFVDRGSLKKSINIPYSQLLSNYNEFLQAVKQSEFCEFASSLE
jgi:hypothetical protein